MDLEDRIQQAIIDEAAKLIERYQEYHNRLHLEHTRKLERRNDVPPKDVRTPRAWTQGRLFNPFYVRRKSASIARSIARKILDRSFEPHPPYIQDVPKPTGGMRKVSVYEVPDAAVSSLFYENLL